MADIEEVKKKIVESIETSKKKLKPGDVKKKVSQELGCTQKDVQEGIKVLVDEGTLTYAYLGGSYLVFPPKEEQKEA
jgi:hypothetical protein